MLDVFILPTGRAFFDLIFAGLPKHPTPGEEIFAENFTACAGGTFNVAIAMHKLGLDIGFSAHLGNDFFSEALRSKIEKTGMRADYLIQHDMSMTAITASISQLEDRALVSYVDPCPAFDLSDLPDHGAPSVIYVPGIPENPETLFDYLDRKKKERSIIVCDSAHIERTIEDEAVVGLLRRLDVFLCNEKEAKVLTNRSTPERAAVLLGSLCPEIVVKLGPHGAIAIEGGMVHREKAIRIRAADSTGAGDGFCAGYVYALVEGMLVERRLRIGNVVGGCFAAGLGSTNAPDIDTVLQLESENYRT